MKNVFIGFMVFTIVLFMSCSAEINNPVSTSKNISNENISTNNKVFLASKQNISTVETDTKQTSTSTDNITEKKDDNISDKTEKKDYTTEIIYGKSGLNRDLKAIKIQGDTDKVSKTILMTFEIHGYEDEYNKDGQILVDIGNNLIKYYNENIDKLGNVVLYIVPSANPDGLIDGVTNNGKGRCQVSKGIDINRDFDYYFTQNSSSRYHTLNKPLQSPEAKTLRDLVLDIKPDIVMDFHGWLNYTIGDSKLAKFFSNGFPLSHYCDFSSKANGYFTAWASTVCKQSLLVELPPPKKNCTNIYTEKLEYILRFIFNS